jgi:hypothetical protein
MSPKYILRNACLLILTAFLLSQCRDEFNDPNPKSNREEDNEAPFIRLISPVDSTIYRKETMPITFTVDDNFSLNRIEAQIASIGKPAPGFEMKLKPGTKSFNVDTMYRSNVTDTIELQMLIFADDSSGNARSKTVIFWMIKP